MGAEADVAAGGSVVVVEAEEVAVGGGGVSVSSLSFSLVSSARRSPAATCCIYRCIYEI